MVEHMIATMHLDSTRRGAPLWPATRACIVVYLYTATPILTTARSSQECAYHSFCSESVEPLARVAHRTLLLVLR